MIHHFYKEVCANRVTSSDGKPIGWQVLGEDFGVLTLDDAIPDHKRVIDDLNKIIATSPRGVVKCSAEAIEQLKKNYPFAASATKSVMEQPLRVYQPQGAPQTLGENPKGAAVPAAVGENRLPLEQMQKAAPGQPALVIPEIQGGTMKPRLGRPKITAPIPTSETAVDGV